MKRLIRYVLNHVPRRNLQRFVHMLTPIMGLAYFGRGVQCPVCGGRYRKFMPYGYGVLRNNALCPSCLALERHRLMWLYLQNESSLFDPDNRKKLLHIAPEHCFTKRLEQLLGRDYVTADLESPLAKVKMDIQAIPFEDCSFDIIFCNHILEHVDDDRLAMREMWRVMRYGGWGIMLSPVTRGKEHTYEDATITTPEGRMKAFGQHDHVREYGEDYATRLSEEGFEVESIDYINALSQEDIMRFGLRSEIIYLVRKR